MQELATIQQSTPVRTMMTAIIHHAPLCLAPFRAIQQPPHCQDLQLTDADGGPMYQPALLVTLVTMLVGGLVQGFLAILELVQILCTRALLGHTHGWAVSYVHLEATRHRQGPQALSLVAYALQEHTRADQANIAFINILSANYISEEAAFRNAKSIYLYQMHVWDVFEFSRLNPFWAVHWYE